MKTLSFAAAALVLALGATASAGEPVKLDDQAMDSVTAGRTALAAGFTLGTFSSGLSGSTFEQSRAVVVFQEQSFNGSLSSSTQLGALSTFTAVGSGPGATSASGAGGVVLALF